jgi:hypothetical protein
MKKLLALALLIPALLWCSPALAAYSPVGTPVSTQGTCATALSVSKTTSGGDLTVITAGWYSGSSPTLTFTDALSNTITEVPGAREDTGSLPFSATSTWYIKGSGMVTGSDSFTLSCSAAAYATFTVSTFSGSNLTSPVDQVGTGSAANSSSTVSITSALTPTQNNELILGSVRTADGASGTPTINNSMSSPQGMNYVAATAEGNFVSYLVQTTATAIGPTWSGVGGTTGATTTNLVTFKAAAAAPTKATPQLTLTGVGQ